MVLPLGSPTRLTAWLLSAGCALMMIRISAGARRNLTLGFRPHLPGVSYPCLPLLRRDSRMPSIGPLELIIVLVIILVIFGPKRLPQAGRSLGAGLREFKDSVTGKDKDDDADKDSATVQASSEL